MRVSGIPLMQISGKRFTPTRKLSAYLFSHHDEFPDFTLRRTRASSSIMSLFYSTLFVFYTIYLLFSFHGAKIQLFYQLLSNQLRFDNTVNHNNVLFHMEDIHPLLVMGDHTAGFGWALQCRPKQRNLFQPCTSSYFLCKTLLTSSKYSSTVIRPVLLLTVRPYTALDSSATGMGCSSVL